MVDAWGMGLFEEIFAFLQCQHARMLARSSISLSCRSSVRLVQLSIVYLTQG